MLRVGVAMFMLVAGILSQHAKVSDERVYRFRASVPDTAKTLMRVPFVRVIPDEPEATRLVGFAKRWRRTNRMGHQGSDPFWPHVVDATCGKRRRVTRPCGRSGVIHSHRGAMTR